MQADLICVVDKGRIVERGTHEELVRRGGIYHKLVSRQMARMNNALDTAPAAIDELFTEAAK
jgi:ABC-type transport system involved in cytochrome bd biosynthesis fused ATPase/permease subunit